MRRYAYINQELSQDDLEEDIRYLLAIMPPNVWLTFEELEERNAILRPDYMSDYLVALVTKGYVGVTGVFHHGVYE